MNTLKLDLVIIGGGVAGLWTLNRAVQAGLNAVLFEKDTLGGGQSVRSQGIIHGGTKYALSGVLTQASSTIKEMPQRWRDCLTGKGELDLSTVNILSDAHYMWSKGSLGSRMTTFFATKAFSGRVEEVSEESRPDVFKNKKFKGSLYRLNELVLDVPSVINALRAPMEDRIFKIDLLDCELEKEGDVIQSIALPTHQLRILPKQVAITSGEGFESLATSLNLQQPEMQTRPLHMVMVKHNLNLPTFAHCIGAGSKPVATITTHPCADGNQVWYLGGNIAETGLERSSEAQIAFAQQEIKALLPWVDLSNTQWSSFHINRAEPKQSSLVRPDAAFAQKVGNCIIAWPTKLALSPDLADQILLLCADSIDAAENQNLHLCQHLPKPDTAQPVWESSFC